MAVADKVQQLRRFGLKLDVSGEGSIVSDTKLYQNSYGFVMLCVYVPVTQNALGSPLLTVYRSVVDETGMRVTYNKVKSPESKAVTPTNEGDVYTLPFVSFLELDGFKYMLFEAPMPLVFTDTVGELDLIFNYCEIASDGDNRVIKYRMTSNVIKTYVDKGGVPDTPLTIDFDDALVAQINANTIAIELLEEVVYNDVPTWIDDKIRVHDASEQAHPYIQELIANINIGDGTTIDMVDKRIDEKILTHNLLVDAHDILMNYHNSDISAHKPIQDKIAKDISDSVSQHNLDLTSHPYLLLVSNEIEAQVKDVQAVIPAQASIANKLVDRNTMMQAITTSTTRFLTYDANGSPFPNFAALSTATTFYYEGQPTTPTNNDFVIVLTDENYQNATTQYLFDGTHWVFMYKVSDVAFTPAQWDAINSNITASITADLLAKTVPFNTTTAGIIKASATDGYVNAETDGTGYVVGYSGLVANTNQNTTDIATLKTSKQDTLVSGTNIKTINSTSILGSGDITITGTIKTFVSDDVVVLPANQSVNRTYTLPDPINANTLITYRVYLHIAYNYSEATIVAESLVASIAPPEVLDNHDIILTFNSRQPSDYEIKKVTFFYLT